jgi:hypothetical protein
MASGWYNSGLADVLAGTIVPVTDTLKAILVTSSYTPDKDHAFASSLTAAATGVFDVHVTAAQSNLAPEARWADCTVVTAAPQTLRVAEHVEFYVTGT